MCSKPQILVLQKPNSLYSFWGVAPPDPLLQRYTNEISPSLRISQICPCTLSKLGLQLNFSTCSYSHSQLHIDYFSFSLQLSVLISFFNSTNSYYLSTLQIKGCRQTIMGKIINIKKGYKSLAAILIIIGYPHEFYGLTRAGNK